MRQRLFVGIASLALLGTGYALGSAARVRNLREQAQAATTREDWNELDAVSRQWTDAVPDEAAAWIARAEARRRLGDFRGTAEALGHIPRESPDFVQYALARADLLLSEVHDVPAAEQVWKEVLSVDRLSAQAWQRLIYLYAMTLRQTEMMNTIRQAALLQREPAEAYVYAMTCGDVQFSDGAVRMLEWTQETPGVEFLEAALAVYVAMARPRTSSTFFPDPELLPSGRARLNRCHKEFPHNTEILACLLEFAMAEGDKDEVRRLLKDARNVDADPRFWRFRGWLLELDRKSQEAERHYRKALAIHPLDWKSRQQLGGVLRLLGRREDARRESALALQGKQLARDVAALQTAADADERLMQRVLAHMTACGDVGLATALRGRL